MNEPVVVKEDGKKYVEFTNYIADKDGDVWAVADDGRGVVVYSFLTPDPDGGLNCSPEEFENRFSPSHALLVEQCPSAKIPGERGTTIVGDSQANDPRAATESGSGRARALTLVQGQSEPIQDRRKAHRASGASLFTCGRSIHGRGVVTDSF